LEHISICSEWRRFKVAVKVAPHNNQRVGFMKEDLKHVLLRISVESDNILIDI